MLESSGMLALFGKLSTNKNTINNLRSHQIFIKMPKNIIIFVVIAQALLSLFHLLVFSLAIF